MSEQLEEIRNDLAETQQAFLDILDEANEEELYRQSADEDWSPAMVLAHISEARQFFANEVEKVLATTPKGKVGRTMDDPHRLQTVENHGQDSVEELRRQLVTGYNKVIESLTKVTEEDLELECEHVTQGSFKLGAFMQRFFVGHDRAHVQQVTDLLKGQE